MQKIKYTDEQLRSTTQENYERIRGDNADMTDDEFIEWVDGHINRLTALDSTSGNETGM